MKRMKLKYLGQFAPRQILRKYYVRNGMVMRCRWDPARKTSFLSFLHCPMVIQILDEPCPLYPRHSLHNLLLQSNLRPGPCLLFRETHLGRRCSGIGLQRDRIEHIKSDRNQIALVVYHGGHHLDAVRTRECISLRHLN